MNEDKMRKLGKTLLIIGIVSIILGILVILKVLKDFNKP